MAFLGLSLGPNVQFDPYSSGLANLSQLEWQQANNQLYPAASQLINYAENPNAIASARAQALSGANTAFGAQAAGQQQLLALQGINPTAAQSEAMNQRNALARAQAEAGASNAAAAATFQNQQAALRGI